MAACVAVANQFTRAITRHHACASGWGEGSAVCEGLGRRVGSVAAGVAEAAAEIQVYTGVHAWGGVCVCVWCQLIYGDCMHSMHALHLQRTWC